MHWVQVIGRIYEPIHKIYAMMGQITRPISCRLTGLESHCVCRDLRNFPDLRFVSPLFRPFSEEIQQLIAPLILLFYTRSACAWTQHAIKSVVDWARVPRWLVDRRLTLIIYISVNSYGHVEAVSSPNSTLD